MKMRIPKQPLQVPAPAVAAISHCVERIDRRLPLLRTLLLVAGLVAAALKASMVADYLFGGGLLLHWAIWFQRWWSGNWHS